MQVTIEMSGIQINWTAKGNERITQNIINLLNTRKYEVAYDRTLGLSGAFIDMPLDRAIAETTAEIYDLISSREPRAELIEVLHTGIDEDGNMQFKVVVEI
ncbi:hypothetical protein DFR58_10175 [Anaerobacterium chartisolvens]|uniref:Uncharacterized protein n=1 Tax=Anaerobacterium chartisolvens TaxID=1297424 RepID=A0A369BH43_9FIRM|nr:hypothetical protein [Anaerobacterium chartisolvens]RCX20873.1 hypothetical protein DFR58_10175 [Anaerobacterium chartisolvens]